MRSAALSIAGLDPSSGAGLFADLRAFEAAGVWGAGVCAALTVQSTKGVRAVRAVPAGLVTDQALEVLADADVRAIKTGALGSATNVRAVGRILARYPRIPCVVDPVVAPSRGAAELAVGALPALRDLLHHATLVTPNLPEAAALLGRSVRPGDAAEAARALLDRGPRAVLVKGGHAEGPLAIDWLALRGGRILRIARRRRVGLAVHGTGCTLASLIAGRLAARERRGAPSMDDVIEAVRWARARLDRALAAAFATGSGQLVIDVRSSRRPR